MAGLSGKSQQINLANAAHGEAGGLGVECATARGCERAGYPCGSFSITRRGDGFHVVIATFFYRSGQW